jgi:hypothetical protein
VWGRSTNGTGVVGEATASSGVNYGVRGFTPSPAGFGVQGQDSGTNGVGVYGVANAGIDASGVMGRSVVGQGVFGEATATTGANIGVRGETRSTDSDATGVFGVAPNGQGVFGLATGRVGWGVRGTAFGNDGVGVRGNATAAGRFGVVGVSEGSNGTGVYGQAHAAAGTGVSGSGIGTGVSGEATASNGVGVEATAFGSSGTGVLADATNIGVYGLAYSGIGIGVVGSANASAGVTRGVSGTTSSSTGFGVHGSGDAASGTTVGVRGIAPTSPSGYGVQGIALATTGAATGVYGETRSAAGFAGYFLGRTHVQGTLSKSGGSFLIDHPQDPANKTLEHSFVEAPERLNIYRGSVTLNGRGTATVRLPRYHDSLNRDHHIHLTPVGAPLQPLHVTQELIDGRFAIAGGNPGQKVYWQVTGVRQDAWAQANPLRVERSKRRKDRGKFLNPEAFGQPRKAGIHHVSVTKLPRIRRPRKRRPAA